MSNTLPDAPKVRIIPPLVYLAGLVIGLLVGRWFPTALLPATLAWPVGGILIVAGLGLMASAVSKFRSHGTTIRPDRAASTLIVDFPYTLTRNPMYVGLAVIYLGITIAAQSLWALILLPVVLLIIQRGAIEKEEAFLEQRFGADYAQFKSRVRRWL